MSYHPPPERQQYRRSRSSSALKVRLLIAGAIILFSVVSFLFSSDQNPVTGEKQYVGNLSIQDEVTMGLQAVPSMTAQHHGESQDRRATRQVQEMGLRLVEMLRLQLESEGKSVPYPFDFHLLADRNVVNAFALPGGQVFITEAIYDKMTHPGQLAGVLGHEIGHVLERHSAQRMAKSGLLQGLAGAAGVAGGDINSARAAQAVGQMINMSYGRDDELESDRWGVRLMVLLGYTPEHMLEVMDILEESSGGQAPPEFLSTHPRPENRRKHIRNIIAEMFPQGLPPGLK